MSIPTSTDLQVALSIRRFPLRKMEET